MDLNRLTQKSQEALSGAQTRAAERGHQETDVEHLLAALLSQAEGLVPRLLTRMELVPANLAASVEAELARRPQVGGGGAESGKIYITQRLQKVLGAFKLLQQTQQAAWGAHTAIRDARHKASSSANDSGFGSLGGPTWRPDPGNSGEANGTDGGWRPF